MRHVKLRSFPTKCLKCGKSVLYWESTAGAKVIFDLPIYGKPSPHRCTIVRKSQDYVKETNLDHKLKWIEKATFQCPVCGKIFDTEESLNEHIKKLNKQDDRHYDFFHHMLDFINWDEEELKDKSNNSRYKTDYNLNVNEDRFILKTKNDNDKKKFEKLLRRKRN